MDYQKSFMKYFGMMSKLLASINDAFIKEELHTSQKQAVIKITEKKKQRQKIY